MKNIKNDLRSWKERERTEVVRCEEEEENGEVAIRERRWGFAGKRRGSEGYYISSVEGREGK